MSPSEMPRERLAQKGASALSKRELLAIIIRSGTQKDNALEIADNLLGEAGGSLIRLSGMSIERMTRIPGIGEAKAISISAAFELGRRFALEGVDGKLPITSSKQVFRMMIPYLKGLEREESWVIFLDKLNVPLAMEKATSGSDETTLVDVKYIARRSLEKNASSIILVHNHPSGIATPSKGDLLCTNDLRKALSQVGLRILDHIIIADDSFFSFADELVDKTEE